MDDLIKLLDENLEYMDHKVIEDTIYINIKLNKLKACCPDCNTLSKRIHSRYQRNFQDLPLLGKKSVIRDGSITYNKAIKDAHPKSIQISDRFHILKNLTDYGKKYIKRILNRKVEVKKLEDTNEQEIVKLKEKYNVETKWELTLRVKELRDLKYKINDIASILGSSIYR